MPLPPTSAVEARWWHPVALETDLGAAPLPVRLLGTDLVLWRDGSGAVHAADDICPHRGARLSLGRVERGWLQCGYHGWCFDGAGVCRRIPALPDFVPPSTSALRTWQVAAAHGLIWLAFEARSAVPDALPGLPKRRVLCGPYDVATSAPRVVENFLDTAHFAFVHRGWLGDPAHTEVPPYALAQTPDGRPLIEHYRAWQPRAQAAAQDGAWVDYRYEVLDPFAALLQKRPDIAGGAEDAYALFTCPLDEERTRVWFLLCTHDRTTPEGELVRFQDSIFLQDRPLLESQRPQRLPVSGGERHCAADRLSVAYRRWLQSQDITFGVC